MLRNLVTLVVLFFAISYYVTQSWLWGYETRWTNTRYVKFKLLGGLRNFTEEELSRYNGHDTNLPIFLAIDGLVYDVTSKPETYGKLGGYNIFAGRDAARAFGTGCFQTDLTHDLRNLDPDTLRAIRGWQKFFENHSKYWFIGYVNHPPLTGPPPPPCKGAPKPE
ncbi:Membrane-associated progesterone-binding protein 4 [Wickerhamiella sorbophila]|uniref:Membrane-associated progesterone-binding protein 4 n=1 Tax=Wickerhamiella sorbophila TaxID=45607 RepID=A0A2T0FJZ0_9ASCO|nr:Membrane-associated progesterone-binding protein 4 [Wickerhamiella sorbophila]PRT55313.1 Membrane-associated progesterone-binding protein 4 [Wickerhamiella sorbophila]